MVQIFISYSRKDQAFVHQLYDALIADGFDVWIDWEDIPPSVDWWREITTGIDSAQTIVFVLSPNSLASQVCNLELAYAAQHNKRLVPIMHLEIVPTERATAIAQLMLTPISDEIQTLLSGRDIISLARDNWKAISSLNWVLFNKEDLFVNSLEQLVEVIETDQDHVQQHTQILQRAVQWDKRGKQKGFLLSRTELTEAISWLKNTTTIEPGNEPKRPIPAQLHFDYISASKRYHRRQRLRTLLNASIAAVITMIVGILIARQLNLLDVPLSMMPVDTFNIAFADIDVSEVPTLGPNDGKALADSFTQGFERALEKDNAFASRVSYRPYPTYPQHFTVHSSTNDYQLERELNQRIGELNAHVIVFGGPDGNLWFTENGKNRIGRMTQAGAYDGFAIPTAAAYPEGIASGPDGNLWFVENSGHKIGRITTAGVITEFPLPDPTRVFRIAAAAGYLWFTEFDGNKIGRISTDGTITEFLIPTSASGPYGITPGPDGHLWFTEFHEAKISQFVIGGPAPPQINFELPISGTTLPEDVAWGSDGNIWVADMMNVIARMTPAGVWTPFPIPSAGADPEGLAAGPDGHLWFTEKGANKIGRLTTAGTFTEFPVLTATSAPTGIGTGPDGALWFTEYNANKIGRITTAGAITELPLPPNSGSIAIAAGSDGNLWFTEFGKNKIGRITPAGDFDEFAIPTASAYPEGITAGADGNLWFSENNGHNIGRVTPDGDVTEFPVPVATRVFRIAAGPDGNLWFTEFDNNKIGRITTAGVLKEYLIPTADSGPYGIAAGTDRRLWFSEFKGKKIGAVGIDDPTWDLANLTPTSGPAAGGTAAALTGSGLPLDTTVVAGLAAAADVSLDGDQVSFTTPALSPGALYDVVVTDPSDGSFGRISQGWLADFSDVPQAHLFHDHVETLVRHSVTAGCGQGNYCPTSSVTRAQMAVFVLRAKNGPAYVPPPATGTVFGDVPAGAFAAALIEALAADGITGGCGNGNYCPNQIVRRDQMAVFLLKAEHGAAHQPPSCTGVFLDVPCPGPFAAWIEELAAENVTGGCGGANYCPLNPVTRGQMATFLTKTFNLQ